jgi:uncharacterized protein
MLLDLSRIHAPRQQVERTFQPTAFDPQDEEYRVVAPVELSMVVEKRGSDTFRVAGRVNTRLQMACGRCLEPFEIPVDASFDLRYAPQTENAGEVEREIRVDDLETVYYREGLLDLTEMLREQFQLSVPMKPLCADDCRGLCPECGANLNLGSCSCAPKWEDPRLAPLKSLLNRSKENS